jgi:TetR/AcrR family transcriptional regulator, tetracycline repressor protein
MNDESVQRSDGDQPEAKGQDGRGRKASPRTPRGTLTRRSILDTVARTVGDKGVVAVTMRGVATELRVDPMALYRHFKDKDSLLAAFVDDVFAGIEPPRQPGLEGAKELARQYFQVLITHPGLVNIDLGHTTGSPYQLLMAERLYQHMLDAGYDVETAHIVYSGLQRFVLGSALVYPRRSKADDVNEWNRVRDLFRALDQQQFPALHRVNEQVSKWSQQDIFEHWLNWIFDHAEKSLGS